MRKIFFYFLFCFFNYSFAQIDNSDSCYAVKQTDTIWKTSCLYMQQQPSFPDGDAGLLKYLSKNTTYPKLARDLKLQGKVYITFIIDKQGNVTDVEIYKGIKTPSSIEGNENEKYNDAAKQINDEAKHVTQSMPKWSPGYQDGKPVKVRYILPFNFKLPQDNRIVSDSCFVTNEKDTTWKTTCVRQQPEYPGGDAALLKFLQKKLRYPQLAKELGVGGKVVTTFVINKSGEVVDVSMYKPLTVPDSINGKKIDSDMRLKYQEACNSISDESLRVIRIMPNWKSGMQNGKPVKVRYIMPISFYSK